MRSDHKVKEILKMWHIHQTSRKFESSTIVATCDNGNRVTVAEMLDRIESAMSFIKVTFNINQRKYSETIKILQAAKMILNNNNNPYKIKKDALNLFIDVIHEIEDLKAFNDAQKQENEEIALTLKCILKNMDR